MKYGRRKGNAVEKTILSQSDSRLLAPINVALRGALMSGIAERTRDALESQIFSNSTGQTRILTGRED